jgi:hypothetical protein
MNNVARNDRCRDETGLLFGELCALVAAVASWEAGQGPVTRLSVSALVERNESMLADAGGRLLTLGRKGLLESVFRVGSATFWIPTLRGIQAVKLWSAAHERPTLLEFLSAPTVTKSGPINVEPIAEAC